MSSKLQVKVSEALTPAPSLIRDDILVWRPFAQAGFNAYTRFIGERACHIKVNDSETPATVADFLAQLTESDLDAATADRPLLVRPIQPLPGRSFEIAVIATPSVANVAIDDTVDFMKPVTYLTFPAFQCEFTHDDDVEDAKFRLAKVGRINWTREPFPVVAMRFKLGTGVKSTGGKGLLLFKPKEADSTLNSLSRDGGFMEVENFKREVVMIKHENGVFTLELDKDGPREVAKERVAPWFQSFLREGAEAAERHLRGA